MKNKEYTSLSCGDIGDYEGEEYIVRFKKNGGMILVPRDFEEIVEDALDILCEQRDTNHYQSAEDKKFSHIMRCFLDYTFEVEEDSRVFAKKINLDYGDDENVFVPATSEVSEKFTVYGFVAS